MRGAERLGQRAGGFFFMQIGGMVTVIVYFKIYGWSGNSLSGLRTALLVGLAVQTGYNALAWSQDYLKQFDVAFWLLFAVGVAAFAAGVTPLIGLYQLYSPALLFIMLGMTAA